MVMPNVRNNNRINAAIEIKGLDFGGTMLRYVTVPCFTVQNYGSGYFNFLGIYQGDSNENLKSAIKIKNTARLSCKWTIMIFML
jgi:hypothetical protein